MLHMHRFTQIAVILICASSSGGAAAATNMRMFNAPGLSGEDSPSVAYSSCADAEDWSECVDIGFGCSTIALYDGAAVGQVLLRDDAPTMKFRTQDGEVSAGIWSVDSDINELNGGWVVTSHANSEDILPVFQAIAENPATPITVTLAGKTIDLAPMPTDRAILAAMASACLAQGSDNPHDTLDLMGN